MRTLLVGTFGIVLGACSYNASAPVSPANNVYSNYGEKIPGQYALYVDGEEFQGEFKVQGFNCSAHTYTQDARSAFRQSVVLTFGNLVENIELVERPLSRDNLKSNGFDGMIRVRAEDMEVEIGVIPGFWTADMDAEVELTSSLRVDNHEGRLLGTTVSGDADSTKGAGTGCDGGSKALSSATSGAFEDLMQRMGERLSNSQRIREESMDEAEGSI